MADTASKLIAVAKAEIGYLEKKTNAQLDGKTENAGYNNWNKYARDLDRIPGFYNGKKNGYYWCDVFVDWCFYKAFGADKARELLCQPTKSYGAGCTYSAKYYKQKGQLFDTPQPGDQIFFGSRQTHICTHTGIVVKTDARYVYTVEGNTSGDNGVIANGGGVFMKKYLLSYSGIYGYGRPDYDPEMSKSGTDQKKVAVLAQEVIDGKWGTGAARKAALKSAGFDAAAVQAEVNRILSGRKPVEEIAKEVILGKWGNGTARRRKLAASGYDPDAVQKEVNKQLK